MSPKEYAILYRIRQGERLAFKELYHLYYKKLCYFANKFVQDLDASEDIVQEVICRIWDNHQSLSPSLNFQAYLYKAVQNKSLDHIKSCQSSSKVKEALLLRGEYFSNSEMQEDNNEELYRHLESIMQQLPENSRRIFEMSRFKGMRYAEIAEEMNISVKGVEYHISKTLRILTEELKERAGVA